MGNSSSGMGNKNTVIALTGIVTLTSGAVSLGWLFYKRINRATHFDVLTDKFHKIEELHSAIDDLRKEIDELKASKELSRKSCSSVDGTSSKRGKLVRFKKSLSVLSSSDTEITEYHSAWSEADDSDDEFFDFIENHEESIIESDQLCVAKEEALQIFERVDTLLDGSLEDHNSAFQLLATYENEFSENVEFLWRMTKCHQLIGLDTADDKIKKDKFFQAVEYGRKAIQADDGNAEAHKWFAIALGSAGEYLGVSEKIRNGFVFKEHIDIAIRINPSDPLLHYLLGRFCYEVSLLSWIERKVATTLFTVIPSGSIEEALEHFKTAEKLRTTPWKENRVFLARCYIQQGNYKEAIQWIEEAIPIPVINLDDQTFQKELLSLQRKYAGYRSS